MNTWLANTGGRNRQPEPHPDSVGRSIFADAAAQK